MCVPSHDPGHLERYGNVSGAHRDCGEAMAKVAGVGGGVGLRRNPQGSERNLSTEDTVLPPTAHLCSV